jgi:lipid-binding SYLF domain-containing protein
MRGTEIANMNSKDLFGRVFAEGKLSLHSRWLMIKFGVKKLWEVWLPSHRKEGAMNTKTHITRLSGAWLFMFAVSLSLLLTIFQTVPAFADDKQDAEQIVEKACMTLDNFMNDDNMKAFRDLLKDAKAAVIAPSLLEGAFVVGASGGNAVAVVRDEKTGRWSQPAFYTIGGASFGLQIGGQTSEVILLAMTQRGANALLGTSFKLGADAGFAAGPVGMGAQAASANLSVDILSFSRSKGLYAGISLDGTVVAVRESLNEAYYGKKASPTDILVRNEGKNPQTACLIQDLNKFAARKRNTVL